MRLFHKASWCAWHEKNLLVGIREFIRRNDFFLRFIMCFMRASLKEFKLKWGYWFFTSYSKILKDVIKKGPPLKPK
jgi:hypothetical protein